MIRKKKDGEAITVIWRYRKIERKDENLRDKNGNGILTIREGNVTRNKIEKKAME